MRGGTACAAWGLAGILALAGCSGDEEAGGLSPSSPPADTSSAPSSSASTAPHDGPPKLPAVARQHTNAGAKAFVRYYIDVLNYAWVEGRPRALANFAADGCDLCAEFVDALARRTRRGGDQTGGTFTIDSLGVAAADSENTYLLIAQLAVSRGQSRASATSPPTQIRHDSHTLQFRIGWRHTGWALEDLETA
jgi:hypothetical protein